MTTSRDRPDWCIDGRQPPAWYYLGPSGDPVAAVVPVADAEASLPYELRVFGSRDPDLDHAGVLTLEDGLAVIERWWIEVNRERANDNRAAAALANDLDRSVPRLAPTPLVAQIAAPHAWFEYYDIATDAVLYRRLEGQGPALNQNIPADLRRPDAHLALVHDRDAHCSAYEPHQGRKR